MVHGGYFEASTEENRYTSKLTITMHGNKYTPNMPIFGNKVIGVHFGQLTMHGNLRSHTWTELRTTANAGATQIELMDVGGTTLDWKVGEEIVIARAGEPIARLVPYREAPPRRRFGLLAGAVKVSEDFDSPLDDALLDAFEGA